MDRENRYVVLKNSDTVRALSNNELSMLDTLCQKISRYRLKAGKKLLKCVVVEHGWPEYEPVWSMIAARVDGSGGEPK